MRLTEEAHKILQKHLQPGDIVVDATVGNGHDTLFLCQRVGQTGQVYGFDIQEEAIANSRNRLKEHSCEATLFLSDHAQMGVTLAPALFQMLSAVIYNLGYLPGAAHTIATQALSTVTSMKQAWDWLKPGGLITVILYRGHPGGLEECEATLHWARGLEPDTGTFEIIIPPEAPAHSPILLVVQKNDLGAN